MHVRVCMFAPQAIKNHSHEMKLEPVKQVTAFQFLKVLIFKSGARLVS